MGPIKFLYNSKFDFTAKYFVKSTVVTTRVHCIAILKHKRNRIFDFLSVTLIFISLKENQKQYFHERRILLLVKPFVEILLLVFIR